jgi:hypothetical protein
MTFDPREEMTEAERACWDSGWLTPLEAFDLRQEIERLREIEAAALPIDTYERPIQQTRILLYWRERGWVTGTYDEPEDPPPNTPRYGFRGDGDSVIAINPPTHWMPLPDAPTPPLTAEEKK